MPQTIEARLKELDIQLPEPPKPVGAYRPLIRSGSLAFLSGQISKDAKGVFWSGKLGADLDLAQGMQAARAAALNVLSILNQEVGLQLVRKIVRVVGYVQCSPDFTDIHKVLNGASNLFFEVFEEAGIHARSAVGMASLPLNAAVEIETTVELIT